MALEPHTARSLRAIVFAAVLLLMFVGPLLRQVFDKDWRVFREWQMYGDIGLHMIVIDIDRFHDGAWQPLDYVAGLKQQLKISPTRVLRINRLDQIDALKTNLCQLYPRARLRSSIRQASMTLGWVEIERDRELSCRPKS